MNCAQHHVVYGKNFAIIKTDPFHPLLLHESNVRGQITLVNIHNIRLYMADSVSSLAHIPVTLASSSLTRLEASGKTAPLASDHLRGAEIPHQCQACGCTRT